MFVDFWCQPCRKAHISFFYILIFFLRKKSWQIYLAGYFIWNEKSKWKFLKIYTFEIKWKFLRISKTFTIYIIECSQTFDLRKQNFDHFSHIVFIFRINQLIGFWLVVNLFQINEIKLLPLLRWHIYSK